MNPCLLLCISFSTLSLTASVQLLSGSLKYREINSMTAQHDSSLLMCVFAFFGLLCYEVCRASCSVWESMLAYVSMSTKDTEQTFGVEMQKHKTDEPCVRSRITVYFILGRIKRGKERETSLFPCVSSCVPEEEFWLENAERDFDKNTSQTICIPSPQSHTGFLTNLEITHILKIIKTGNFTKYPTVSQK